MEGSFLCAFGFLGTLFRLVRQTAPFLVPPVLTAPSSLDVLPPGPVVALNAEEAAGRARLDLRLGYFLHRD